MIAPRSLSGRLLAGAAVFVVLAILLAGASIGFVLDRFIHGQVDQRLDGQIHAVADALRPTPGGSLALDRGVDAPPFDRPGSGWTWQASGPGGVAARSRSLGDQALPLPAEPLPPLAGPPPFAPEGALPPDGPPHGRPQPPLSADFAGPAGQRLHGRAAATMIGDVPVSIQATAPLVALRGPVREALVPVGLALAGLGFGLILAVLAQVRLGLRPLAALRTDLAAVRQGRLDRIPENQPREVGPLVSELNALLAENAAQLAGARRHVSNLAHGLKTPLATLALGLAGEDRYRALLDQMDRQIRHHLTRARAAALGGTGRAQTQLAPVVADLVDALAKIYAERGLAIEATGLDGLGLACDRQDLDEMLGNLLDNACRWARGHVRVRAAAGRPAEITIEDDGPGLPDDAVPDALRPGRRLDESAPGYGFGLPITRDLAALYGGILALDRSPLGGLRATLRLPMPAAPG